MVGAGGWPYYGGYGATATRTTTAIRTTPVTTRRTRTITTPPYYGYSDPYGSGYPGYVASPGYYNNYGNNYGNYGYSYAAPSYYYGTPTMY